MMDTTSPASTSALLLAFGLGSQRDEQCNLSDFNEEEGKTTEEAKTIEPASTKLPTHISITAQTEKQAQNETTPDNSCVHPCEPTTPDDNCSPQRPRTNRPNTANPEIAFQFTTDLKKAPINHAYKAFRDAIDMFPVIPDDKKEITSKKISSLLLPVHRKDNIVKRYNNVDWVPKPIQLKPFLAAPDLIDTKSFGR